MAVVEEIPGEQVLCRECRTYVGCYRTDGLHEGKLSHLPAWRFSEHLRNDDTEVCPGSHRVHTLT
ncbi:hypothetical protein M2272_005878 [Mycobacterium frederiksbergense]|uniref:Uncharacterized protein n=1 Tax=Mycolicibacterium frederiksbergense TaxID=117567 RepID=A0ABT6LA06_9MYCO|nr:hypothetical protein [Mycolicibacterium frederiksbergense]MDH6199210.1 hypothetical protein [Mycolicibacterium frederiksbergense]